MTDFCRFGKRKKNTQITKILKTQKYFRPGDKMFLKMYCGAKEFWEEGVISKRVGGMLYMLKSKKYEHQRHINQLRPRYTENVIEEQVVPMEVLYDVFNIAAPIITKIEKRTFKRKEMRVEPFSPDPKRKRYLLISEGNLAQWEMLWR